MSKKIIFYTLLLFFTINFTIYCSNNEGIEEIDFSGSVMIENFNRRITDDSLAEGRRSPGLAVSRICTELQKPQYINVKILNLSNNFIMDEGAERIANFLNLGALPHLEELNLSHNRISENGIAVFSQLLEKEDFKALVIYGNNGAASIEGIERLTYKLSEEFNINQVVSKYLAKVIWIPQNYLKSSQMRGIFQYYIKSHEDYYNTLH